MVLFGGLRGNEGARGVLEVVLTRGMIGQDEGMHFCIGLEEALDGAVSR